MIHRLPLVPVALIVLGIGSARADETVNYQQLQAMPRERRLALSENLERFDKLDPSEQAEIRKLDAQLAAKDPIEQAKYRALLHRYHLWVNGLTEEQRRELRELRSAEARYAKARQFSLSQSKDSSRGPRLANIRTGAFGLIGPYEAAHILRIWFELAPARRTELEKKFEGTPLFNAIREEGRNLRIKFQPFPAPEEQTYSARLEGDSSLMDLLGLSRPKAADPASNKPNPAATKAEAVRKKREHPIVEFLYFQENPPPPVLPKNLERFSAACPAWVHIMVDPLSPDDARDYLTILYRLLYPLPKDFPADTKATKAPASGPPAAPKDSSKKANSNVGPI